MKMLDPPIESFSSKESAKNQAKFCKASRHQKNRKNIFHEIIVELFSNILRYALSEKKSQQAGFDFFGVILVIFSGDLFITPYSRLDPHFDPISYVAFNQLSIEVGSMPCTRGNDGLEWIVETTSTLGSDKIGTFQRKFVRTIAVQKVFQARSVYGGPHANNTKKTTIFF